MGRNSPEVLCSQRVTENQRHLLAFVFIYSHRGVECACACALGVGAVVQRLFPAPECDLRALLHRLAPIQHSWYLERAADTEST